MPCSFFSWSAVKYAARSIVRTRVRMPTVCSWLTIASPIEV